MKRINEVKMEFPSNSANEGFARGAVACMIAQLDPTMEELGDIKTAVSEAVTNCIVHAYPDEIGLIQLECGIFDDGSVEITVADSGCGIEDIKKARKPLFSTGGAERSGMGFTIMESFMNELDVESEPGKGTKLVMRRKIRGRRGGESR